MTATNLRLFRWIHLAAPSAVALCLLSLIGCGSGTSDPSQSGEEETAATDSRESVVSALGRLEPLGEVIRVGVPLGNRLDRLEVAEGQVVQQGQVLAYLDGYSERLADQSYFSSRLREAERRLEAETLHGGAIVREAEARIQQLKELQPLEILAQEAEVRLIEAELATATSDLKRIQSLLARNVVSRQELDHQALLVSRSQAQLEHGKALLSKLLAAREVDLVLANEQLATAKANLLRNQTLIQTESLRANLAQASARLERTIIRSPVDGQILRIISRPGESLDDQAILEMGNTAEMLAIAEVYETAVAQVRLGQRARITSRALEQELTGQVIQIGATIHKNDVLSVDPTSDTDARVVEVKIRLDESTLAAALVNLQVDIQILTGDHSPNLTQ